jgi:hypothetical protein
MSDDFDWDGLKDDGVEACLRGTVNLITSALGADKKDSDGRLDLAYVELLTERLKNGIKRIHRTERYGRHVEN